MIGRRIFLRTTEKLMIQLNVVWYYSPPLHFSVKRLIIVDRKNEIFTLTASYCLQLRADLDPYGHKSRPNLHVWILHMSTK